VTPYSLVNGYVQLFVDSVLQ